MLLGTTTMFLAVVLSRVVPIDFDHLTDDVGFTPVLVNHTQSPIRKAARHASIGHEYVEDYVLRAIPTTMLRTPEVAQIPVTD